MRRTLVEQINLNIQALELLQLPIVTDATRGAAGQQGRLVFNSDDGLLNIDNGTNWTLPDGTTT